MADLGAVDTLLRNTLGTHVVAPVVGILDTLEVVAAGTLRVVVAEALMVGTLEAGKVTSTLSVQSDSKFKTEWKKKKNKKSLITWKSVGIMRDFLVTHDLIF